VPGKDTIVPHPVWQNCYWRSSGQLPQTTVEDERWRSQSETDHRLDGGVRPLNTSSVSGEG